MSGRNVRVLLSLDASRFTAGLAAAEGNVKSFAAKASGDKTKQSWDTASTGLLAFGAAATAAAGVAVKSFADFDKAMSGVASTGADARNNIDGLRDAAMEAGARTAYSATEAANAIEELAKAGVDAADVMGGALDGALDLAAAGQMDVAHAAEITATTLQQFALDGSQASHVADLLAAGAGKAQGEVHDLGLALSYAGIPAAQLGVSLEETTGTLALFASQGIIGEKAGTSLREMLMSLTAPTARAKKTMDEYGISLWDAQGKFIGLEGAAGVLQDRLGGLTDAERSAALGILFGNSAIGAANILVAQGAEGVRTWTDAVNDQGFAAETAATKMDNLAGDLEKLGGSLETLFIGAGSGADGPLRALVQSLTGLLDVVGSLPTPITTAGLTVVGFAGVTALLGGGLMKGISAVNDMRVAFQGLGWTANTAKMAVAGVSVVAVGFTVATAAIGAWAQAQAKAKADTQALSDIIREQGSVLGENSRAWAANELVQSGAATAAEKVGINLRDLADASLGSEAAIGRVTTQMDAYRASIEGMAGTEYTLSQLEAPLTTLENSLGYLQTRTSEAQEAARQHAEMVSEEGAAAEGAAGSTDELASAVAASISPTSEAASANQGLADAINGVYDAQLAASGSMIALEASYDGATEAAQKNGQTAVEHGTMLEIDSEAGRANKAALDDIASSHGNVIDKMAQNNAGIEEIVATTARAREQFIASATAMGMLPEAAAALADAYGLIPEEVATRVTAPGVGETQLDALKLKAAYAALPEAEQTVVSAPGARPSKQEVDDFIASLEDIDPVTEAHIRTIAELSGVSQARAALATVHDKTVTITTRYHSVWDNQGNTRHYSADGNVLDFYAGGGLREHHVAQIAPAGTWRVWAEPETGGEAYIPLAPSKRLRSRSIAEETVKRLDGMITWFADGDVHSWDTGRTYPAPTSTQPAIQAGGNTVEYHFQGLINGPAPEHDAIRAFEAMRDAARKVGA